jgi:signal transduction histidine kinase
VNLVDNAVKYTGPGGQVGLSVAREGERVRVEVSDTGRGIPLEEQEQIFQPFFRSEAVLSEQGSGLGLSIARSIALAHGGELSVESEPGKGSTFRVGLPVETQAAP